MSGGRMVPMRGLRVEEPVEQKPVAAVETVAVTVAKAAELDSVAHWRKMAIQAAERLTYAENQLNDLRTAADEARARFGKYKTRLDSANARVNELQSQLISVCAERDSLRDRVADQKVVAMKVHAYRQSLINGPLWDLFAELAVSPLDAGEEKK